MKATLSFFFLITIKFLGKIFYKSELNILSPHDNKSAFKEDIRIIALLNHTSLYEPIFAIILPRFFLKRMAHQMVLPVASKTTDRPIVGMFFKLLGPNMIPITRKKDASWNRFKNSIDNHSIVVILPEGRMKRLNGLDSNGKKMTIRPGFAEILNEMDDGKIMLTYSGGLHHIQSPGQVFPRLFKTVKANIEILDIKEYKKSFEVEGRGLIVAITKDLQKRLENKCP